MFHHFSINLRHVRIGRHDTACKKTGRKAEYCPQQSTIYEPDAAIRVQMKAAKRKSVVHTLITTYGGGEEKSHSIAHSEVTMDDLFNT